jgi:hypothetical protein
MDEPSLDEVYRLVKENNQMIRAMRRDAFVKGIIGFIWWILILIVIPYVSWLYIQPYLEKATAAYAHAQGATNTINTQLQGLPDINKLIQQLTGGK